VRIESGVLMAAALVAAALPASGPARADECLRYEPEVVRLHGQLRLTVFPGPPHYRSLDAGDQPETVWLLALDRPACIDPIADDAWNIAQSDVRLVQIIPRAPFNVAMNGKPGVVEGTLYRAHGGHPHAEIVLRATGVVPD
jgi:hypothetical protein